MHFFSLTQIIVFVQMQLCGAVAQGWGVGTSFEPAKWVSSLAARLPEKIYKWQKMGIFR